MRILTILTVLGSTAAWLDCRKAKSLIKSYRKTCPGNDDEKNALVAAGLLLVEGKKREKCLKVTEVFDYALKNCKINTPPPIDRLTLLLGGKPDTVGLDANMVVVPVMYDLLHESRINVGFDTIEDQLRSVDFFSSNTDIADKLLAGLKNFKTGLDDWGSIRSFARGRIPLSTIGFKRFTTAFFRSFPAGYILAAICEVTSAAPGSYDRFSSVFGVKIGADDLGLVLVAISQLVSFDTFTTRDWLEDLTKGDSRELLRALLAADFVMERGIKFFLTKGVLGLPGLVFVRWVVGKYSPDKIGSESRIKLASDAALKAVQLAGARFGTTYGSNWLLRNSRKAVVGLLESQDDGELDNWKSWIMDAHKARKKSFWRFFTLGSVSIGLMLAPLWVPLLVAR